jgi:thioredoxin 1
MKTQPPESVVHVNDITAFNEDLTTYKDHLIILTFFTDICSVCKAFAPQFAATQKEFQNEDVYFARINAQNYPQIAQQFDILGVPYTIFIKDKEIIQSFSGLKGKGPLRAIIKDLLQKYFKKESKVGQEFDMMYM